MNNWNGVGRLTAQPELRYTANEVEVCSFTLAVDRRFKSEGQPEADFINCVAFKNTAKLIAQYVSKGNRLAVSGRIQTRSYENEQGNKIYVTEVIVENMTFLEPKKEDAIVPTTEEKKTDPFAEFGASIAIDDDDLPF